MLLAVEDAAGEGIDGWRLIALRFVGAYELEVHQSIIWEGQDTDVGGAGVGVNMGFGMYPCRQFVLSDSP